MSLSVKQVEALEDILFSDAVNEESLDYYGVHGLICASEVGPSSLNNKALSRLILGREDDQPSDSLSNELNPFIDAIAQDIREALKSESGLDLPFEDEEEDLEGALESWCAGFMEGFFENESAWVNQDDSAVASMMLPIMAWSQMFDSDDFNELYDNENLMQEFSENIGDVAVDLFLFFHA